MDVLREALSRRSGASGGSGRGAAGEADPAASAAMGAAAPALVTGSRVYTWAELDRAVDDRVRALSAGRIPAGSRVPAMSVGRIRAASGVPATGGIVPVVVEADEAGVLDLLALWRLGAVPAPLNARLTQAEREVASTALTGWDAAAASGGPSGAAAPDVPAAAQVVLWTSGTTGSPRGVALSWEGLDRVSAASAERLGCGPDDVWLTTLSPAHVGGLVLVVRALLTGAVLVAPGPLSADELSAVLDGGDADLPPVTCLSLVPTQLQRLLDRRGTRSAPPGLRCVLLGGAPTPEPLLRRALDAGWPVALTYGMTEMTSQVATAPPELVRRKPGTVGRPLTGVEVRVADSGEIRVRGRTLALGYLSAGGAATGGAARGGAAPSGAPAPVAGVAGWGPVVDEGGWYATGDLGRVDDEGHLWITGRRGDRIITGGVNVDPLEVEAAVRAHPSVADVCVVGLPDPEWGEAVSAWVVPVEGEFDLDEIQVWLADRLAGPKRPRRWALADAVPVNANGKPDRVAVRERMLEA